ncbi:MAG: DinB family protein, partial [Bacteroidetes bacterium]|nr:DinB family protein [Bacteroidota bacterium]
FTTFFGLATDVQNTTMGATDMGQRKNIDESRQMVAKGYELLDWLIKNTPENDWLSMIETPFFGKVTQLQLFSHVLFHTSHHAGQISLTLSKGSIVN